MGNANGGSGYNATLLPLPTSYMSHPSPPSVGFGASILPDGVDKDPSTNTNRPEPSGVDVQDRRTKEG